MKAAALRLLVVLPALVVTLVPVISVVLGNSALLEVNSTLTLRPAAVLLGGTIALIVILRIVYSELRVRAAAVFTWLLTLWLYPALYRLVWPAHAATEWVLAATYVIATGAFAFWSAPQVARRENQILLNGLAIAIAVATIIRLAMLAHLWAPPPWSDSVDRILREPDRHSLVASEEAPDIYYVVLDGMSRLDTLRDLYGINVGAFAHGLRARGLSIAAHSSSNYSQTHLSLASALNMTYLDDLAQAMGDSADRTPLRILVQRSRAISRLREAGYEFVMIGSDYSLTISHPQAERCECGLVDGFSELESALINRSPFRVLPTANLSFGAHRRKVLQSFDSIAGVRRGVRPMLVFAHILTPHPPFVFGGDGSARWPAYAFSFRDGNHFPGKSSEYLDGYREQAQFVMGRVLRLIDAIRAKGPRSVIILHGDHGSGLRLNHESVERSDATERLGIFAAVGLPYADASVPDDITPVNVLRFVLNRAIGAHFEMLQNRSFMSSWEQPYRLIPAGPAATATPLEPPPLQPGRDRTGS